jgi:general nucleoside transport system permease protein
VSLFIHSEKSGITNLVIEGFQGFGAFVGVLSVVLISNFSGTDVQNVCYVELLF